jgi:hypothetical protein
MSCGEVKYSVNDKLENADKPAVHRITTRKYAGRSLLHRFIKYSLSEADDQQLLMMRNPLMTKNPQTARCPLNNFERVYFWPDNDME